MYMQQMDLFSGSKASSVCLHNCFSGCERKEVHVQISQAQEQELARLQTERDSPLAQRRDVFTAHDV